MRAEGCIGAHTTVKLCAYSAMHDAVGALIGAQVEIFHSLGC